jgi:hypothetical protein
MTNLRDLTVQEIAEQMAFHLAVISKAQEKNEALKERLKEIAHGKETT